MIEKWRPDPDHNPTRLLDALGIVRIPANEVTLDPILLGCRFKRLADQAILGKAGVTPSKNH